ncbi:MAG: hypothetical protein QE271_03030 [Bacteriovoracaceae bacterium]|nr:hypothetical protein [Bacteriovoracaceae bacterium]
MKTILLPVFISTFFLNLSLHAQVTNVPTKTVKDYCLEEIEDLKAEHQVLISDKQTILAAINKKLDFYKFGISKVNEKLTSTQLQQIATYITKYKSVTKGIDQYDYTILNRINDDLSSPIKGFVSLINQINPTPEYSYLKQVVDYNNNVIHVDNFYIEKGAIQSKLKLYSDKDSALSYSFAIDQTEIEFQVVPNSHPLTSELVAIESYSLRELKEKLELVDVSQEKYLAEHVSRTCKKYLTPEVAAAAPKPTSNFREGFKKLMKRISQIGKKQ